MVANPREGSRLLRFSVKAPNTNSEIGTTRLARARARRELAAAIGTATVPKSPHIGRLGLRADGIAWIDMFPRFHFDDYMDFGCCGIRGGSFYGWV